MAELNPENELVIALREQWQKMCGLVMSKLKVREVRINVYDIGKLQGMFAPDEPAVVVHVEKAGTPDEELVIELMDQTRASKMARDFDSRKN
jgi:hypothetical protein